MDRILKETLHKAKKDYVCSACYIMLSYDVFENLCTQYNLTPEEVEAFKKAEKHGFCILKGETYLYQVGVCDGDFYSAKTIPEIHEICLKRGFYNED
jgi:hypothetical protein